MSERVAAVQRYVRAKADALAAARGESRWESERAEHLRDGARADTSRMRRADLLTRAAWRAQRGGAGLAGAPVHQQIPARAWRRWTTAPGGERRRRGLLGFAALATAGLIGIGLGVGYGAYRALEWSSPRIGRLWWWPWAALAALLVIARWLFTDWPVLGFWVGVGRYFPSSFIGFGGWAGWISLQVIAALGMVAFQIWAWGWAGVPKKAVAPASKNKDGSWRVTPDSERLDFAVYGADDAYVPPAEPEVPTATEPEAPSYWGALSNDEDSNDSNDNKEN